MFSFKVIYAYNMLHIKTQTLSTVMTQMASRTICFFFYRKSSIKLPLSNKPPPSDSPPPTPFLGEES